METLINLLQSSVLLGVFFLVYYVLLKNDTYYQLKRLYFYMGLLLSVALPWIYFTKTVVVEASKTLPFYTSANTSTITPATKVTSSLAVEQSIDWYQLLLYIYLGVTIMILLWFTYRYLKLYAELKKSQCLKSKPIKLHITNHRIEPFSFINHIVLSREDYTSDSFNFIFAHEATHIRQWHSLDVLLVNLACACFWFNPMMWLYRTHWIQNLEHIADLEAIKHKDKSAYQYLLLNRVLGCSAFQPVKNSLFQPSIKQRIMMLNKCKTSKLLSLKSLLMIPILVLFILNFQVEIIAQEQETIQKSYSFNSIGQTDKSLLKLNTAEKRDPFDVNNYTSSPTFIENKSYADENINEYDKIIVLITKHADQKFLDYTEKHLEEHYGFKIQFNKVKFNDKGELISIVVNVKCNDGFEGSTQIIGKEPISNIYFYRDYTEHSSSPFGIGGDKSVIKDLLQYTFSDKIGIFFPQHDTFDNSNSTLKQKYSVDQNTDKTKSSEHKLKAETASEFESLNKVKTFIINGKSYELEELRKRKLIVESYQFLNDETLEVYGEFKDDLLDQDIEVGNKLTYKNLNLILFGEFDSPIFFKLEKVSIEKKQP